ncbi:conserved hypothetical protein [Desulfamplus magnetovallimortis]|uniref:Uncharacterized protein n=1 Tax=Desulfamplus magnetovallimortis TaxID=1246637 RepID=A0A1W1HFQ2_9BACT|nr:hypothetical protein [Desulfamplus magnetovallimortis]SLM31314.1 conserved hypothetical protein [Desulfamplus magnetovallimortis]
MTLWYEPETISEWLKRGFSLLNILILSTAVLLVVSEMRFDWCEYMIGHYLASINSSRPETGAIWKAGEHSSKAHIVLKNIIEERQDAARYAQEATSFAELASGILPGQWANIDREQFKRLYLALPPAIASEIISPTRLIWLYGGDKIHDGEGLHRIFCEGKTEGLDIFFLNAGNRVLHHINLDKKRLDIIERGEEPFMGTLDDIPEIEGRIYSADLFFNALFKLPPEILPDLITTPHLLLNQRGDILRAGIWNEVESGFIKIGFEIRENGEYMVLFIKAREWAVWRLSAVLSGQRIPEPQAGEKP